MTATIRVEKIQWFDEHPIMAGDSGENAYPGCDGAVWYEVVVPGSPESYCYAMQPFARGRSFVLETRGRKDNVWAWDGDRAAPSLTPSFLCEWAGTPLRAHLYLTRGQIQLCGDSTVRLA